MKQKRKRRSDVKFDRGLASRLLSMGFSQNDVASLLKVHKTTIGKFVRDNNINTVDNTKSIGRHLQETLTTDQLTWLYSKVSPTKSIIDYISGQIIEDYIAATTVGVEDE